VGEKRSARQGKVEGQAERVGMSASEMGRASRGEGSGGPGKEERGFGDGGSSDGGMDKGSMSEVDCRPMRWARRV
jgi:hypothetical protein